MKLRKNAFAQRNIALAAKDHCVRRSVEKDEGFQCPGGAHRAQLAGSAKAVVQNKRGWRHCLPGDLALFSQSRFSVVVKSQLLSSGGGTLIGDGPSMRRLMRLSAVVGV